MRHEGFTKEDKLTAASIVRIFETGKPLGDYAAVAVLDDGAGISYGISQFTHRSGSLAEVVEKYFDNRGIVGRMVLADRLPKMKDLSTSSIETLSIDTQLKAALKAAAATNEMRSAQREIATTRYMRPALSECERLGFTLPLSLAVVYDSITHGSWSKIRDMIRVTPKNEKGWITAYVLRRDSWLRSIPRLTKTTYRTKFFLSQIMTGRWTLELPMTVHGVRLTKQNSPAGPLQTPAETPPTIPAESSDTDRDSTVPATRPGPAKQDMLETIERGVNQAARHVDQAERIVVTTVTRTDKAKSLWTTVLGTLAQAGWAVAGFVAGLPREIWLVVAVIAAILVGLYLYRQIALGKIRESN
jgi:chitosanase